MDCGYGDRCGRARILRDDELRAHSLMPAHHSEGQVVVVTGASAGVGRAVARAFGARGARVGLLARGRAGLEAAKGDVEAAGGRGIAVQTDVADPDQVETAARQVEEAFGPIDVWVNNAMTTVFAPVKETRPEEFKRVTEVTYLGVVYGTLSALRRMLPRDRGAIVQVGSALAYRGIPLQAAYCAAKHAIQGFCDSLRSELLHDRSRVTLTMVQLPALNTPQFDWARSRMPMRGQPVPPIFQPEVAAEAVLWASDHDRREMYVGAPTVKAIVGDKMFPAAGDWLLAWSGYTSQQTPDPRPADAPDNLFEPVDTDRDFGAHGRFDARARDRSWQLWLTEHRIPVLAGALAAIAAGALSTAFRRSDDWSAAQCGVPGREE
jgi:NAD(P)-dependent dehydrogenase (short-subunit alcohol dehydrogenase family)